MWKEIELSDKQLFDGAFARLKPQESEMSFAHFFMWKKDYNLRYSIINDMICLMSDSKRYVPFSFAPIPLNEINEKDFKDTVNELKEYFAGNGWELFFSRVSERMAECFRKTFGTGVACKKSRDTSDYLYLTEKLISLQGKKLSSKRNHINKFLREYGEYEYVPIEEKHTEICKSIYDDWFDSNEFSENSPEANEREACFTLLDNWSVLGMKGALIKVNDKFEAYTVGEMLNDQTAVIHIEKANVNIHGLYTLINRDFCQNQWSHTKYINREEDMGLSGLRKAKLSYKPEMMINKYCVKYF